jgi:F0F1-type ATP synthase assembly protein I
MMWTKHRRWLWAVVSGVLLGAVLGDAIGIYIRSDNLPFFDVLGAVIGMVIGFMLFMWRSTRSQRKGRHVL